MLQPNLSFVITPNITDFSNTTTADFGPIAIIFTVFTVAALFFNGLVMLVFLSDSTLLTPFNVYIINLLIANILVSAVQNPFEIIIAIYDKWWLGEAGCTVYIYANTIFQAGVSGAHILIAVNRTWAITHPLSYRSIHSKTVAVLLCLGMQLYNHLVTLPGIIPDALFYRNSVAEEGKCYVNTEKQPKWGIAMQLVMFNSPEVLMVVSMVIIVVLQKRRSRRSKSRQVGPTKQEVSSQQSRPIGTSLSQAPIHEERESRRKESHGYRILVFLTFSSVVCWTPLDVYWDIILIVPDWDSPRFYAVASVLHMAQVVIDPILFTISSPNLRKSMRRLFRGWCKI